MLLHKDGKTNIIQGDSTNENLLQINNDASITNVGDWIKDKKITKVLMNPPFEKSTGVKILKNVLDNVLPNTDVAFILPDRTLLTKNQNIIKQILNKHRLICIIKMPEET
jgi:type I restriction-modification system DNA methylase subunit